MYDDASMPNMQRITWNGIALHGGPLPGYAASHGCVRMPFGFAEKLFDKTRIGMRVIISPDDAEPVEFSHPSLPVPKAEAIAAAPARAETHPREAAEAAKLADETKKAAASAARETAALSASLRKLEGQKTRADAELAAAEKAVVSARTDEARARAEDLKQKATAKATEPGRSSTPSRPTRHRSSTPRPPPRMRPRRRRPGRPPPPRRRAKPSSRSSRSRSISAARRRSFTCAALRTKPAPDGGGIVFDATIEVPVKIRNPERPIGTHVFTAVARNETGLRWNAVTIDHGDDAKSALDRITIPQDVLDRIAPTALPRSSIIISDEALSKETNYRTEFVAVLSNQPQGGFITRKPTPPQDMLVAGPSDDGFSSFFQPAWNPQTVNTRRRGGQEYQPVQPRFW